MKSIKIVFISSMLPSGHFSQILTQGIAKNRSLQLIVYTDINPKNRFIKGCGTIKPVWRKNILFTWDILRQLQKDKPDIIHIQQELNMYGGTLTVFVFPILLLCMRLLHYKVVVTIHAAVYKEQITKEFISLFTIKRSFFIKPYVLKLLFTYIFSLTSIFSHQIIVHTLMMKDILVRDWFVNRNKIVVIPTGIPQKKILYSQKKPYFFYFGYMVRRKGLEYLLNGFKLFHQKYPHYKLKLAGGTIKGQEDALAEIKHIICKMNLQSSVDIIGFVEDKQLDRLYSEATAVVIPAKVSMGSSGPLYHAQSYGKCIIASNVGHFLEDIENLKDGILTDNAKWQEAMEFVVKNPDIITRIEKNVVTKTRKKGIPTIAQRYCDLYHSLYNNDESRHLYSNY